ASPMGNQGTGRIDAKRMQEGSTHDLQRHHRSLRKKPVIILAYFTEPMEDEFKKAMEEVFKEINKEKEKKKKRHTATSKKNSTKTKCNTKKNDKNRYSTGTKKSLK